MAVNFEAAVGRAWKFATNIDRLAAQSVMFIVALSLIVLPVISLVRSLTASPMQLIGLAASGLGFVLGIVIGVLILVFSCLMFTHNYANQKSLSKSADFAKSRYLRFLAAMIIVGLITGVVSSAPILGIIFAIIAAIVFFFIHQAIAVSDKHLSDAFSLSYGLAKKNVPTIIITFIISAVIALVVIAIFAIPFLLVFLGTMLSMTKTQFFSAIMSNLPLFLITGIIIVIGVAFATLLTIGIKTDVYMQIRKKK